MNTERLRELGNKIEKLKHHFGISPETVNGPLKGFSMSSFEGKSECGTAGCIAGHACDLFGDPQTRIFSQAQSLLDLDDKEAFVLFTPWIEGFKCWDFTPAIAAEACHKLASLGETEDYGERELKSIIWPTHEGVKK